LTSVAALERCTKKKPPGLAAPAAVNSSSGNCNALAFEAQEHGSSVNISASLADLAKNPEQLSTWPILGLGCIQISSGSPDFWPSD
jgi:hypothetical protein